MLGEVVLEAIHDAMDRLGRTDPRAVRPLLDDPSVLDAAITYQRPPGSGPTGT